MKQRKVWALYGVFVWCVMGATGYAAPTIVASKVDEAPVIDGKGDDPAWAAARPIVVHDDVADIDVTLKAVHTGREIFFLVTFPDPDESREHKTWTWDKEMGMYRQGAAREDAFVFKWNMAEEPVDLSVYSDHPYLADIWFWKACRTDPAGFADDKVQQLSPAPIPKARKVRSRSGKTMYFQRIGDTGREAYRNTLHDAYQGDTMPHFASQMPSGSRADIRAKGIWSDGVWTIEFHRALDTGHEDDVRFDIHRGYQFGVSRYEIAGRDIDPEGTQPLFGMGDVSGELHLEFQR